MLQWQIKLLNILNEKKENKKLVFFVGSGISFDPLANLPSWYGMIEGAMSSLCSDYLKDLEKDLISRSKSFMPEILLDILSQVIGEEYTIDVLNVFNSDKINNNHVFLASLITKYNVPIITTNYDELIEFAAKEEYNQDINNIRYVDNDGFINWLNSNKEKAGLFKLHGTLYDKNSIKAIISQIAKGIPEGMLNLLKYFFENYHIIFWGYSFTDQFDIVPILLEKVKPKNITWIKFGETMLNFTSREDLENFLKKETSKLEESITSLIRGGFTTEKRERIQEEKHRHQSNVNYLKLILKTDQYKIINYFPPFPIYCVSQFLEEKKYRKTKKRLNEWVSGISEWDRMLIAAEIFFNLREEKGTLDKIIDICNKLINILEKKNCKESEKWIHAYLLKGWAHRLYGEHSLALKTFEKAEEILNSIKSLDDRTYKKKGYLMHQKGIIYQRKKDFQKSMEYLKIASKVRKDLGDRKDMAYTKFQKFFVKQEMGEFKEGYLSDYIDKLKGFLSEVEEELSERGLIKDKNNLRHNRAYIHQLISIKYSKMGDYKNAIEQFIKGIDLYIKTAEERNSIFDVGGLAMSELRLAQCYRELANIFYDKKKTRKTKEYIMKAEYYIEKAKEKYSDMGDSYRIKQVNDEIRIIKKLKRKKSKKRY